MPRKPEEKTGLRPIDRVRQAYGGATRSLKIPEWEGMELFFGPLTTADMEAVEERNPKNTYDRNIVLLIHKAKDSEGKPLFGMGDKTYLRVEGDFVVLQRIISFMFGTTFDLDAAKKEVEENPT